MSTTASSSPSSFGGTLAGGIQDVAAILPLIGTDQCDKHVGSALTGGYLYSAAAPLSIFGSLGIVKAGISIFISSISISIPNVSISFHSFIPSVKYLGKKKILGGRLLKDAGFELTGTVAPLIGMDGHRFKAETRLVQLLEEKHIDDHEKISVSWKSRKWNTMLVLSTLLAAILSIIPYIALLLGPTSWRPKHVHLPWMYPLLRISGSCLATITSQLITQSHVISLMKNRIIFTIMHQRLNAKYKERLDAWLKDPETQWDPKLPAERCLWSLEQSLLSPDSLMCPLKVFDGGNNTGGAPPLQQTAEDLAEPVHISVPFSFDSPTPTVDYSEDDDNDDHPTPARAPPGTSSSQYLDHISTQTKDPTSAESPINDLRQLQQQYFPYPTRDAAIIILLWLILGLSLPSTVAGYIGCFTLVGATPSNGNGPLVWVGLEAALSILRIVIWASNPDFDEETEVTVELKLSDHQPMVTTNDYNPYIADSDDKSRMPFALIPEDEFLARITPFTGPLDKFQKAGNINLYFTLTAEYYRFTGDIGDGLGFVVYSKRQSKKMCLLMTVFDFNMQLGVTFVSSKHSFFYCDVNVQYNTLSRRLEAKVRSEKKFTHPWPMEDDNLFHSLEGYYRSVAGALKQRDVNIPTGRFIPILPWRWDLLPQFGTTDRRNNDAYLSLPSLTPENQLYLDRGYEHHLKTELVRTWGQWIITDMDNIRSETWFACHEALKDTTTEKAIWELTERDVQLVWGWAKRELVIIMLSLDLEDILYKKMEACVSAVTVSRGEAQSGVWMRSESHVARRKRLEQEMEEAKKRMRRAMEEARKDADSEGRPWTSDWVGFLPEWNQAMDFIDRQWLAGINGRSEVLSIAKVQLDQVIKRIERPRGNWANADRNNYVKQLKIRLSHEHWCYQHQIEENLMKSTIERVRHLPTNSTRNEMMIAYQYSMPDPEATRKFARLLNSSSKGKACSGVVYDASGCPDKEVVCNAITNNTTRSMVNVAADIIPFIPSNEHLLFLSNLDGKAVDLPLIQQNRDNWLSLQSTNSWTVYFTPMYIHDHLCYCDVTQTIAHILIFLTAPSPVRIHILHRANMSTVKVSLRRTGKEVEHISAIPPKFQLQDFQTFVLQSGIHDLELVPKINNHPGCGYFLRDIFVELSQKPSDNSVLIETRDGVLAVAEDVTSEPGPSPSSGEYLGNC